MPSKVHVEIRAHPTGAGYSQQQGFTQQGAPVVAQPQPRRADVNQERPRDYLCSSICVCLCCFWPVGLCAIYYAYKSGKLLGQGDVTEATKMANKARILIVISVIVGVTLAILVLVLRVVVLKA